MLKASFSLLISPRSSSVATRASSFFKANSVAATAASSISPLKSERDPSAFTKFSSDSTTSVFKTDNFLFNCPTLLWLAVIEAENKSVFVLPTPKFLTVASNVLLKVFIASVGFNIAAFTAAIVAIASFFIFVNPRATASSALTKLSIKNIFTLWNAISILIPAFSAADFIASKFAIIATAAVAKAAATNPIGFARTAIFKAKTTVLILVNPETIEAAIDPALKARNPAVTAPSPIARVSMLLVIPTTIALAPDIAPANNSIPPTSPIFLNKAPTLSSKFDSKPGIAFI